MEKFVRPTDTPESQKPEEALQPLAATLLESAQWRRLNGIEDKTPEVAKQLATEQAKRAEQLVLSLRKHSSSEDRQRMTSEQLTNPESRLYKDARAAIYIQEVNTQTQKNKGLAGASKLPVSGKLPESEQRRLLLPIEYALQAAKTTNGEYVQHKGGKSRSAAGMGRAAVIVTGPTSSSDKSAWEGAKAAAA
jgi:hypothetical protein